MTWQDSFDPMFNPPKLERSNKHYWCRKRNGQQTHQLIKPLGSFDKILCKPLGSPSSSIMFHHLIPKFLLGEGQIPGSHHFSFFGPVQLHMHHSLQCYTWDLNLPTKLAWKMRITTLPENRPSQKETIVFQLAMFSGNVSFREGIAPLFFWGGGILLNNGFDVSYL